MTNTRRWFLLALSLLMLPFAAQAQVQQEIAPPYNIKTASFMQQGENVFLYFKLRRCPDIIAGDK